MTMAAAIIGAMIAVSSRARRADVEFATFDDDAMKPLSCRPGFRLRIMTPMRDISGDGNASIVSLIFAGGIFTEA